MTSTLARTRLPTYPPGAMSRPKRKTQDEEAARKRRAARIKELKEGEPDLTWKAIADHVGVEERAAKAWAATGGISYINAKRLAELFAGVDADFIMRGPPAPDAPMTQLDRIEEHLKKLDTLDDKIDRLVDWTESGEARALLQRLTELFEDADGGDDELGGGETRRPG